jgi:hypothetical protein
MFSTLLCYIIFRIAKGRTVLSGCARRSDEIIDNDAPVAHASSISRIPWAETTAPARMPARAERWSILAWQVDDTVGEVQGNLIQREIGVLDLLREDDIAVAIIARKSCGAVGDYGELPDLKFFGGNRLVIGLNDRDFVQKPICPTVLCNVVRAVGVENVVIDAMPVPVFAAGKLREVVLGESLRRHIVPLSF